MSWKVDLEKLPTDELASADDVIQIMKARGITRVSASDVHELFMATGELDIRQRLNDAGIETGDVAMSGLV